VSLEVRPVQPWRGARSLLTWLAVGLAVVGLGSLFGNEPPPDQRQLARRNFLVVSPGGLEIDAGGVPDSLSATLLLELLPGAQGPQPVELSVTWVGAEGAVLQRRSWQRLFSPTRPEDSEYISLQGVSPSRPRVVRLARRDFPPGTRAIRLAALSPSGRVLARLYSRVRRTPRLFAGPADEGDSATALTWEWKPAGARRVGGGPTEGVELLRVERGEWPGPLPAPVTSEAAGWYRFALGEPLAFDLEPGSYAVELDPPGASAGAQLLEVGAAPRQLVSLSGLELTERAALLLPGTRGEGRIRLVPVQDPRAFVEPTIALLPTYLLGPESQLRPWCEGARDDPYQLALPPRLDRGALRVRVRSLGRSGPPPESLRLTLRWSGAGGVEVREVLLELPSPQGERSPWPGSRTSGTQTLTLSPPAGARTLRVESDTPALVDTAWAAAPRRVETVASSADARFCRPPPRRVPSTAWGLEPSARPDLEFAGRRVLLEVSRGAVRPPSDRGWRLRSLSEGPSAEPFLFPARPEGTPFRRAPRLGSRLLRRLRGPQLDPCAILVPGAQHPRQLLAPAQIPPPLAFVETKGDPLAERALRPAHLAEPSQPLVLEAELEGESLLVVHVAAVSSASYVDVDLSPAGGGAARRPWSQGPVTPLRRRFVLPHAGVAALRLEPGPQAAGPCARLALRLGADLRPGAWRIRFRPKGALWVSASLGPPSLLAPGHDQIFQTFGAERIQLDPQEGLRAEALFSDHEAQALSATGEISSRALGLRVLNAGTTSVSVRALAELTDGSAGTLAPAESWREVLPLPSLLRLPHAGGGVLRLGLHSLSPPNLSSALSLKWVGAPGSSPRWIPRLRLRPDLERPDLERPDLAGRPGRARAVWHASRTFQIPPGVSQVRISGAPEWLVSAQWLRAKLTPVVIRDLAKSQQETLWRDGVFDRLPLPRPTRWLRARPPELAPVSSATSPELELIPLRLLGAEDRIELREPILVTPRPEDDGPAPIWRPLRVGVGTAVKLADLEAPEARLGSLRVRYRGLKQERLPLLLRFSWRGRPEHEERIYVPAGEALLRDLPVGPGVLRVDGPALPSGSLWVRLNESPAPGDQRIRSTWAGVERDLARFDISQARVGDLLQFEVFGRPPGGWSRFELELRRGQERLGFEVHWCRAGEIPLQSEDGQTYLRQARVSKRLELEDLQAPLAILRGALPPGVPLRGVLLREAP